VALPVAVFVITGNALHGSLSTTFRIRQRYVMVVAALVIGLSWTADAFGLAATVAMMALVVAGLITAYLIGQHRTAMREIRRGAEAQDADHAAAGTG
jgi:hypothetical protein